MKSNPKTLMCNWRKKDREEEKKRRRGEREDETYKAAKSFEQSPSGGDWRSPIATMLRPYPRDDHPRASTITSREREDFKGGGKGRVVGV